MDTRTLLVSFVVALLSAGVVALGLTEVLKDVIWPSAFVGLFVGFMTGVVVFASVYLFFSQDEPEHQKPAGGLQ